MHENEDVPLDLPQQTTFSTSAELVLSHLDAFDRRLMNQPNAIVSEEYAWYQMTSLGGARLTLPQLLSRDLARGPFVLTLTDLSRSNVFVDADWNITRIIDLEFACAWPMEFWQTPHWLDADFIDQIDYDKLAARHRQFISLIK
ncbi:Aminoglycoside phosphotransferase [Beauveria brongniartii RCEF 3172]|uniref:Aminoglycoside phosphotransferase n=1 Tax=Beauveria brongniartii RCEF 3172 TaxID=1081107 RepID=A0A167J381_9HYPO|nr:Aminoglycoside phosphotransferase [Beauveria brongniartii RCEF 3172]